MEGEAYWKKKVLSEGLITIGEVNLAVLKPEEEVEITGQPLTKIEIRLIHLPLCMWDEKQVKQVVSRFGDVRGFPPCSFKIQAHSIQVFRTLVKLAGGNGIRTHDTILLYVDLANQCLKPLSHTSKFFSLCELGYIFFQLNKLVSLFLALPLFYC